MSRPARERCLRLLLRMASNASLPVTRKALSLPAETEETRLERLVAKHEADREELRSPDDLLAASGFCKLLREAFAAERLEAAAAGRAGTRPAPRARGGRDPGDTVQGRDRRSGRPPTIARLSPVHGLTAVTALRGLNRPDATIPDKDGEPGDDDRIQDLSTDGTPCRAIERRGRGPFLPLDPARLEA